MIPAGGPDPRAVADLRSVDWELAAIEAQSEVSRLAAALAASESRAADAEARAEAAERQVGELEAALEPFAVAGMVDWRDRELGSAKDHPADDDRGIEHFWTEITIGHLRAATRALRREPQT